jgi:transposase
VRLGLSPGEAHDNRLCVVLLAGLLPKTMVLADRGYDADCIRALVNEQGAWANIPPKRNRRDPICFSPYLYRSRNLLSGSSTRSSNADGSQPDMTRSQQTIFIKLASIRIWLRAYEFTP